MRGSGFDGKGDFDRSNGVVGLEVLSFGAAAERNRGSSLPSSARLRAAGVDDVFCDFPAALLEIGPLLEETQPIAENPNFK